MSLSRDSDSKTVSPQRPQPVPVVEDQMRSKVLWELESSPFCGIDERLCNLSLSEGRYRLSVSSATKLPGVELSMACSMRLEDARGSLLKESRTIAAEGGYSSDTASSSTEEGCETDSDDSDGADAGVEGTAGGSGVSGRDLLDTAPPSVLTSPEWQEEFVVTPEAAPANLAVKLESLVQVGVINVSARVTWTQSVAEDKLSRQHHVVWQISEEPFCRGHERFYTMRLPA
eukprot:gene22971-27785_t